jgi:hypothetical protein
VDTFTTNLARAWRLPSDNAVKETLWKAAVDCPPGSHIRPWRCPCGDAPAGADSRVHTLWACQVAQAVRAQISTVLQHPVTRPQLWLLHAPRSDIHDSIWHLVCVSALHAMEFGRQRLWASPDVREASNRACDMFWQCLHDYSALHTRTPFPANLPAHHPFVYSDSTGMHVRLPAV